MKQKYTRRSFTKQSGLIVGAAMMGSISPIELFSKNEKSRVPVSGHLWVYASKYPPDWDCTLILEQVFADFKYAGMDGLEVMESVIRHPDAVDRITGLIQRYRVPLTGASYNGDMWIRDKKQEIFDDVSLIVDRLHQLKANTFGITVGDAGRPKTENELDAQAELLTDIIKLCESNNIQYNLHNHTFEVINGLHDLKGTLARIPGVKFGPDLNWLIRGGVDPVGFIETYGKQMVYMHIRDQYANGKWTEYLGQGSTDFPAIVKALHKVNFKGRAAIELAFDNPPVNAIRDDWKTSREYVSKVFGW